MIKNPIPNDSMTHQGAVRLAAIISEYWRGRGFVVKTWVEELAFVAVCRSVTYHVRSDLVNGWPKKGSKIRT